MIFLHSSVAMILEWIIADSHSLDSINISVKGFVYILYHEKYQIRPKKLAQRQCISIINVIRTRSLRLDITKPQERQHIFLLLQSDQLVDADLPREETRQFSEMQSLHQVGMLSETFLVFA